MTSLLIKLILWSPFFIIALIMMVIGSIFNRIHKIFSPLAFIFLSFANFILNLVVKDMVNSSKGTPLEKYMSLIHEHIKK